MTLPPPISDYFSDWLMQKGGLGFILLDEGGRVRAWGGALQRLGIEPPRQGQRLSEHLALMEGLLPLTEPVLQLPMVKLDAQHVLDIHLFAIDGGYGMLLMDVRREALTQGVLQQKANETALLREGQAGVPEADAAPWRADLIENLFFAGNMAALRLDADGSFSLIGRAPCWLNAICPYEAARPCRLDPNNFFSFLGNFLNEAYDFWNREAVGCIKSGLWIETDEAGQEHLFEAIALYTGSTKVLLISRGHSGNVEKQNLIQTGREIALRQSLLERTQCELKQAHDHLEMRVKERTRELERINARLARELAHREQLEIERSEMIRHLQQAQKMEAIGTLAGGIAHDFNNILSAVMGFTELSLIDAPKGSPLENNLQRVLSAGQRAKKLISQILTFSRHTNPETLPVQLVVIIKEAVELLRASLTATIEIQQNLKSEAYVLADPSQLHQVVMNLCTNATQAMQPDGGILKLTLKEYEIGTAGSSEFPDMPPGSYLELTIADTGNGMSPEMLNRIYDPFFTTKQKGHGTGLGLSVVHGIVKNCKGDITVVSKVGLGTTFRIILPTTTVHHTFAVEPAARIPGGDECILYVDDEPMQADMVQKFLKPLGYQVDAFTDSTMALQAFIEAPHRYDMVVTDMFMPKMTGKTMAAEIKKVRADIPIILCTGYGKDAVDPSSIDPMMEGCLIKPFSMNELVSTIRKIIESKRNL